MTDFDKLIAKFEKFPGVGARQARRFVQHLLTRPETERVEFANLVENLKSSVWQCHTCYRFYTTHTNQQNECRICADSTRQQTQLLVLAQDSDILAIEKSGTYSGTYFVLGGTIPLLKDTDNTTIRSTPLKNLVKKRLSEDRLEEIILGLPINPDGENTARFIRQLLADVITETNCVITQLGRGLSTGSELEYADGETIKSALQNRGTY